MATFPVLKTGAVAQYPLEVKTRFQTLAVRFLDGSRQKYRLNGAGLRVWTVKLEALDDGELAAVISFAQQQGSAPFAFTDPISGQSVPKCVISGDRLDVSSEGEMRGGAKLLIGEIV